MSLPLLLATLGVSTLATLLLFVGLEPPRRGKTFVFAAGCILLSVALATGCDRTPKGETTASTETPRGSL